MSTFGHGARRKVMAGSVATPTTAAIILTKFTTDVSGDTSIDQEEQTTLNAQTTGGAKSFLYGNSGETGELQVQFDKEGELIFWLEDIKNQGVINSDFNITIFDYPFGNASGSIVISRPIKINGYRIGGGIASKVAGSISFTRSGQPTVGLVP